MLQDLSGGVKNNLWWFTAKFSPFVFAAEFTVLFHQLVKSCKGVCLMAWKINSLEVKDFGAEHRQLRQERCDRIHDQSGTRSSVPLCLVLEGEQGIFQASVNCFGKMSWRATRIENCLDWVFCAVKSAAKFLSLLWNASKVFVLRKKQIRKNDVQNNERLSGIVSEWNFVYERLGWKSIEDWSEFAFTFKPNHGFSNFVLLKSVSRFTAGDNPVFWVQREWDGLKPQNSLC